MTQPSTSLSELAAELRRLDPPFPEGAFAGSGIVIAAGGAKLFTNAYVLVWVLRRALHCTLPIEIWHFGAAEMSPLMAALLRELDVSVVDAVPRIAAAGARVRDGWQLKAFCLMQSRFRHVLLLDADQVPVSDPAALFDWPHYRDSGAVFWRDIVNLRRTNPIWAQLGLAPPEADCSFESGQLLIDKQQHWRALSVALALNEHAELIYHLIYGDKDTFLLSWLLTGEACSLVPHIPFRGDKTLFHRDFDGNLLFQHRTNGKWSYGVDEQPTENFQLFDACKAALEELRQRWNGRVFNPPDRSAAARETEARLTAAGTLRIEWVTEGSAELDFMPYGEFGRGRAALLQNWWCTEEEGAIWLNISDGQGLSHRFRQEAGGAWTGQRLGLAPRAALLTPLRAGDAPQTAQQPGIADAVLHALGYPDGLGRAREALELLALADKGIAERLRTIAREHENGDGPLAALVAAIDERSRLQPIDVRTALLQTNYSPAFGTSDA